jgi:hypothetical protein
MAGAESNALAEVLKEYENIRPHLADAALVPG